MKHCQGTTDKGIGFFDSFLTLSSKQKLQQALKSWLIFSLGLLAKGKKYIEQLWPINLTTCINFNKSMYEFWHIHVSISLNPCHNQGWECRSSYWSKRKISNVFMGSKNIEKYCISNIEFLRGYFCNFFCVFRWKSRFLKVKNRHFRMFRSLRHPPPLFVKKSPWKRSWKNP